MLVLKLGNTICASGEITQRNDTITTVCYPVPAFFHCKHSCLSKQNSWICFKNSTFIHLETLQKFAAFFKCLQLAKFPAIPLRPYYQYFFVFLEITCWLPGIVDNYIDCCWAAKPIFSLQKSDLDKNLVNSRICSTRAKKYLTILRSF